MGRKEKFVVEIDEKYVDQEKHQMVTYIIGKAYDRKFLQRSIKQNCRTLFAKKACFPPEVKKSLQATKTLPPPPPRYQMVRPLYHVYVFMHREVALTTLN